MKDSIVNRTIPFSDLSEMPFACLSGELRGGSAPSRRPLCWPAAAEAAEEAAAEEAAAAEAAEPERRPPFPRALPAQPAGPKDMHSPCRGVRQTGAFSGGRLLPPAKCVFDAAQVCPAINDRETDVPVR